MRKDLKFTVITCVEFAIVLFGRLQKNASQFVIYSMGTSLIFQREKYFIIRAYNKYNYIGEVI